MFALIMTVIIDVMGSNLILPLLPILLVQTDSVLLSADYSQPTRFILYGLAMAAWPLGIFIGTPYLSGLSDSYGRKRILILALLGTGFAFMLSALSIIMGSFVLFVVCRLMNGFFSGTFSIAQASITHTSQSSEEKIRKLGWLSFAGTIGAVLGPMLSGYLVGEGPTTWGVSLPFWVAAILGFINIGLLYYRFNEVTQPVVFGDFQLKNTLVKILTEFRFIFIDARTRYCMIWFSLLQIGWGFYMQSLPLVLSEKFKLGTHNISIFFMMLALSLGIAQITVRPILAKLLKPVQLFILATALLGICATLLAVTKSLMLAYILTSVSVVVEMLAYTGIISLFSDTVTASEQGKVMGGTAAIFGLSWMLSAILTGQLAVIWLSLPIACCGLLGLLVSCLAYRT